MFKSHSPKKKSNTPWPTKDAMEQIYTKHLWGGQEADFYSGDGSHDESIVKPYLEVVSSFLTSFEKPLSVCDLGCGDFNVGRYLVVHSKSYTAVDIVPALIDRNKQKFQTQGLNFFCLDLAKDELPKADCAIIRQVLQHLSNAEIAAITAKLSVYKYVIVTEHVAEGDFIPNLDIISCQGIRLKKDSGVVLTAAPFQFKRKSDRVLLNLPLGEGKGQIVTTLYEC